MFESQTHKVNLFDAKEKRNCSKRPMREELKNGGWIRIRRQQLMREMIRIRLEISEHLR
jgi:hypothetical protein